MINRASTFRYAMKPSKITVLKKYFNNRFGIRRKVTSLFLSSSALWEADVIWAQVIKATLGGSASIDLIHVYISFSWNGFSPSY